jgi:hypothetical protein
MRRVSPVLVLWVGFVIGGQGCHELYPFEVEPAKDSGGDQSQLDAALKLDGGGGAEGGLVDAPADLPDVGTTDVLSPDSAPPDHGPYWDQGGQVCSELLVSFAKPIQVSRTVSTHSGAAPSITAIGDTFYVAFTENGEVLVREIPPPSIAPTVPTFSAKLNLTGKVAAPWITYNKAGNKLAVAWHETTISAGNCPSNLYFRELSPGALTPDTACLLNPSSLSVYGYGPASLVHDGTSYMLVSPVQYPGYTCNTHAKIKYHQFTGCTPFSGGYSAGLLNTFHTVVAATGNSSNPYLMIRLNKNGSTTNVHTHYSTNGTNFPALAGYSLEPGVMDRPSVVATSSGAWFAWANTSNQIRLMFHDGSTGAKTPTTLAGYARHPFMAHKPQVGSSGTNARTVLAFTETGTSGSTATAVKLAALNSATQSAGITHTVAAAASTSYSGAWSPADTVVAAGTNGFGVAWTEKVSSTQTEVFFQWVGCQP